MKQKEIKLQYLETLDKNELSLEQRELLEEAVQATQSAYAPYSLFKVGAAVRLSNDKIIQGSNQENIAYPSGLCAERVALYAASAAYPDEQVKSIAITVDHNFDMENEVFSPCGACRQVMAEIESRAETELEILILSPSGNIQIFSGISKLLPFSFHNDGLSKKKK